MLIKEFIINESVDNVAVFYGGRFQPMHQGHFTLYSKLKSQFGASNVFIATTFSKAAEKEHAAGNFMKNPFTFGEKQKIMSTMFGIDPQHILQTSPYQPKVELTGKNPESTAVVLVFSAKDTARLSASQNVLPYPEDDSQLLPATSGKVYFIEMPIEQGGMSATDFRETMKDGEEAEQKQVFQKFFGKFDQGVFDFIKERLSQ